MITLFWHYMHGFWKKVVWGWESNVRDNVIKGHQPHLSCGVYDHTAPFILVPFHFLFIPFVPALSFLAGWPSWGFLLFSGDYFSYLASRDRYDTIWYGGVILPSCLSQISLWTSLHPYFQLKGLSACMREEEEGQKTIALDKLYKQLMGMQHSFWKN